jgi:hypothetical protein
MACTFVCDHRSNKQIDVDQVQILSSVLHHRHVLQACKRKGKRKKEKGKKQSEVVIQD